MIYNESLKQKAIAINYKTSSYSGLFHHVEVEIATSEVEENKQHYHDFININKCHVTFTLWCIKTVF